MISVTASSQLQVMAEQAERLAHDLGHRLDDWQFGISRRRLVTSCRYCDLYAVVSTAPDEDPFEGSTLRVPCKGPGTKPHWFAERSTALCAISPEFLSDMMKILG